MNYFQVERFPDAMRTLWRFAVCLVPAFFIAFLMRHDRFSDHDPVQYREMIRFQQAFVAGVGLSMFCLITALFAVWQCAARSLLEDEGGLGWLSIHGWNGEVAKLPHRGLLPISELLGILTVTFICGIMAPAGLALLPMSWSVVRLVLCWKLSSQDRPLTLGVVWLLHATAILWCGTIWLAMPVELLAIMLTESLMVYTLRSKAEELLMSNVTFATKPAMFASSKNPSPGQLDAARKIAGQRLYPFSQLSAVVQGTRPSWMMSNWSAIVIAWVMFCVTTRASDFGEWTNEAGREFSMHGVLGLTGMFSIMIIGIIRMCTQFETHVWSPRISQIARMRLLRPIIWSWDRVLLPLVLAAVLCVMTLMFVMSATPAAFAVLVFVEVIIILRCGVSPEEWQMTSDARLTSTFLSSGSADNRAV